MKTNNNNSSNQLWLAKDDDGEIYLYSSKPEKHHWSWKGTEVGLLSLFEDNIPNLKWNGEPISIQFNEDELFYRFGEIPKDEKSAIWKGEECVGYEEGVSVYEAHKNSKGIFSPLMPFPYTDTTFDSYTYYINYFRGHHYLVKGDVVGYGKDGEPLIKNIQIVETLK